MVRKAKVTYTSDSAFHALGLPDADDLVLRADLMRKIGEVVVARGLTERQFAEFTRMDQSLVSAFFQEQISAFSTDRLLQALSDLGQDVELRITPASTGKGRLRVAA
jgi:predicted XRE-type DNA-binding protein